MIPFEDLAKMVERPDILKSGNWADQKRTEALLWAIIERLEYLERLIKGGYGR